MLTTNGGVWGGLAVLQLACGALYAVLAMLVLRRGKDWARWSIVLACLLTAVANGGAAFSPLTTARTLGAGDLVRALAWFGCSYWIYAGVKAGSSGSRAAFAACGMGLAAIGLLAVLPWHGAGLPAAPTAPISLEVLCRLLLAVTLLLLAENLYFSMGESSRWHMAPLCVALGGFAVFDIVLCSELVLVGHPTPAMLGARVIGTLLVAPLVLAAATRLPRGGRRLRLSRSAAFHSATLILSGCVILVLAAAGALFRVVGVGWGDFVQASLAFAAAIGFGLLLTTRSARSRVQRVLLDHFFAERYDYRREWLNCTRVLSGEDDDIASALPARAVRVVAAVVDSPAGALFLRDAEQGPFAWAGSWNMASAEAVPATHPVIGAMRGGSWVACRDPAMEVAPLDRLGPLWLGVPLLQAGQLLGFVLVAPPRAPFQLEQEVFDLLRTVAQEVATYLMEQRATQRLLQARDLNEYGKRFAFVAHDIKNVSSQLGLMLANARHHIQNPEFQKDMLETVDASVRKIGALLQRLEQPEPDRAPAAFAPLTRLETLVATYRRVRKAALVLEHDGSVGTVAIGADAFEAAVTHLVNNAVEASATAHAAAPVCVRVRHEARRVVVDVVDQGAGMSAEFVRDRLFRPFETSKEQGSGIGAWQARELIRAAGGELEVLSQPGRGTTMRLSLPRTDTPSDPSVPARPMVEA